MERREFIGSILGFYVGTQVPWIAQRPVYKHPSIDKQLAHRIRALHLKRRNLKLFKAICVLDDESEIIAPKVEKISIQNTEFGHTVTVTWEFVEINIKQELKISNCRLIDDLGYCVVDSTLVYPVHAIPGDTVRVQEIKLTLA